MPSVIANVSISMLFNRWFAVQPPHTNTKSAEIQSRRGKQRDEDTLVVRLGCRNAEDTRSGADRRCSDHVSLSWCLAAFWRFNVMKDAKPSPCSHLFQISAINGFTNSNCSSLSACLQKRTSLLMLLPCSQASMLTSAFFKAKSSNLNVVNRV